MATRPPAPMTLPTFSMQGKVCMVTGAARGLGLEFCRAFIQSGCTSLVLLDLRESDTKAAAEELTAFASTKLGSDPSALKLIGIACDVSSETSVKQAFTTIIDTYGRIDVVVASAGIVENYPALGVGDSTKLPEASLTDFVAFSYPVDRIKLLFDINVHGVFYTAREAARNMIPAGGGSIILIASMSANIVNIPQLQTPYNASKAAVKHMASSLAVEWAKQNVRVNCLSPGYMLTKLTAEILQKDPELKATWEGLTPMGRMGVPDDLAGAIVFLASDASKFVTGSENTS